jgi:transcription antitermination factor NusA-like protein
MKLVELYEGTLFDCHMIKNLLENEGIESILNNEIIGTRGGNVFGPAGEVKIIVSDDNYDKAKMIVDEFEKSRKG